MRYLSDIKEDCMGKSDTSLKTLREELLNGESFYKIVHASIGH